MRTGSPEVRAEPDIFLASVSSTKGNLMKTLLLFLLLVLVLVLLLLRIA